MKKLLAAIAIATGCALLPSAAAASTITIGNSVTFTYSGSGATASDTCSVCTALATFKLVDADTISIELENTSTFTAGDTDGGNIISVLNVDTTPAIGYKAGTAVFSGVSNWEVSSKGGAFTFKVSSGNTPAALKAGQKLVVQFDLQSPLSTLKIDLSQIHWVQTGGLGNNDSDKGYGTPYNPPSSNPPPNDPPPNDPPPNDPPPVPTPEPGSMMLLGSGLMLAARSVRRRFRV